MKENRRAPLDSPGVASWSGVSAPVVRYYPHEPRPSVYKSSQICGLLTHKEGILRFVSLHVCIVPKPDANTYTLSVFHYMLWWCGVGFSMLKK